MLDSLYSWHTRGCVRVYICASFSLISRCGCVRAHCAGGETGNLSAGSMWALLSSSPPSQMAKRTAFSLFTTHSMMRKRSVVLSCDRLKSHKKCQKAQIMSLGHSLFILCVLVPSCVYKWSDGAGSGAQGLPLCLCCVHCRKDQTEVASGPGSTKRKGYEWLGNSFMHH